MRLREKKAKIAIISRESDEKTLDVAMLEEELRRRGAQVWVLSKLLTKEKSVRNAAGYIGHVVRQEAEILRSDVVVLDTYCIPASMLPHRKGTKVIQLWHALGAVKKFGWQTVGRPDGTSERTARMMRMHKGYDYVISPSDATSEFYSEAFRVEKDRIVKLGLPRIDYIRNVTHGDEAARAAERVLRRYLPDLRTDVAKVSENKTVLYAPTFRRGAAPDVAGLADALDPERYNLIVKLHPLYGSGGRVRRDHVIYDEEFSTYELMAAADIIISDYSSLVIEGTLADKPLYLYIYDEEEYAKNTGLNMDFASEPIGKYAVRSAAELARALDDPYDEEALREFGRKYIEVGGAWSESEATNGEAERSTGIAKNNVCTEELADFIIKVAKS